MNTDVLEVLIKTHPKCQYVDLFDSSARSTNSELPRT
jgi:hypothetical protein